ncbi:hypothetical protein C0991_007306 [Blastosporella zonata]|nr:hypothetical protein C0991_007306 [Blastosporella zonata]
MKEEGRPAGMQTQHNITSSTQLDLESGSSVSPEIPDTLVLDARRLRLQVQRMSERILELEDQHREIVYTTRLVYPSSEDIGPPNYVDADSYTYTERITHG